MNVTQMPIVVEGTPVIAEAVKTEPKYSVMAAALLKRCREFYQDTGNEKAFLEWMAERSGKNEKAAI